MTCIAYRNGFMASDSTATMGGSIFGFCRKIARNSKGDLAGASGDAVYMQAFLDWFEGGEKKKRPNGVDRERPGESSRGIIVRKDGKIEVYEFDQVYNIAAPYFAIGSGRCEALGAMFIGASAFGAVEAAIAHDTGCGGKIVVLSHTNKKHIFETKADGIPFQ